ncbi:MAG: DEAD/DEAH box helicase family protein [Nitriliruptor sp.]|uniref:DEAD/DEAH box helicase family protein n=1 Tax=Nitriliruptor sp. TaxID=2448056 RepID=UPI0034A0990B
MRYTLKDYQDDAVGDVLGHLERARHDWHRWQSPIAFSLTATTGAGKTVMAAAVIEALFDGSADHDFEPDPGAVVLWFTDDPSLNEQTRFRLMDAADQIAHSRLEVIENTFNREKLEAGKVYFLNAQKLSRNSLLVKGAPEGGLLEGRDVPPDARAFTMWDTLANTIADEDLTLYLVLDEAHRGMRSPTKRARAERATIVQRLVNGANGVPPVPIVWGISATVERFDDAMAVATGRTTYPPVRVDPARVQESGLLKDDIRLEFPTESGTFDTVLLARATRKVREATELWQAYADREGASAEAVRPLLVVQVPNKPSDELLLDAFTTIDETWPELAPDAMAHVFGEHTDIRLGGFDVPYISPELVEDRRHIRVLFAKDAISTGWDCPRAEVLVSFRPAQDETHITQLLGRMVRTPLARRVPGDDLLNSVVCVLPHFNRSTAADVARAMVGDREHDADGTGGGDGRRVMVVPVDMHPNPAVPETVWDALEKLPSQTLPRRVARPLRRLMALAHALSRDGLRDDARKEAYRELCAVLDGLAGRHRERLEAAREDVIEVGGETINIGVFAREVSPAGSFVEIADDRAVEAHFQAAGRALTPDLARVYAEHIAVGDEDDDGLFDAHVQVAALARLEGAGEELDREADQLASRWFDTHRVAIKSLPDERRTAYDEIKGLSPEPQRIEILRPRVRTEETEDLNGGRLPTRTGHLMTDDDGHFPVGTLNRWEIGVLDAEMDREGFQAWYRNPSRPSEDALAVAYQDGQGHWRRMCPDFVFFHGDDHDLKISIVDPHGTHLGDALDKLRGLAAFAEEFGEELHRVEAIAEIDGDLRVLDLKEAGVRQAVEAATDPAALYCSGAASSY